MITASALACFLACSLVGTNAAARAPRSPFRFAWRVVSVTTDAASGKPRTHAQLVITNAGGKALPPGWTLYFTEIADAAMAEPAWPVRLVAGSLFAVTAPVALPAHGRVTIAIDHPGEAVRDDKGPTGPYLTMAGSERPIDFVQVFRRGLRADTPGAPASQLPDPAADFAANAAWQAAPANGLSPILPEPAHWRMRDGPAFAARLAAPQCAGCDKADLAQARRLSGRFSGKGGLPFRLTVGPVAGETSPEAYRLDIGRAGVRLVGASSAGLAYGLRSLEQLVFTARRTGGLRETEITDAPRFAWRGLMLDPARNFLPPARVIEVMDLMARFKLNRLHLHLSDDEGWRLAIREMPELTRVGAFRGAGMALLPAHGSGPHRDDPHGSGYYSEDQYIAMLQAAQARHIEVVPEFDLPGHARAAIMAMRTAGEAGRLDDPQDTSAYVSAQRFSDNAINPAMPGTRRFVARLAAAMKRIHAAAGVPLHTLHIGGDEVPEGVWTRSPATAGASKAALWTKLFADAFADLHAEGLVPMGWEEMVLLPGSGANNSALTAQSAVVQVWNDPPESLRTAAQLANAGFGVVLSPSHALYLDLAQGRDPAEPGHDWAGLVSLETTWRFDPLHAAGDALDDTGRANILGIEATLFGETVRAPWRIEHMLMPRLLAVAERAWSQPGGDWGVFSRRLGDFTLPFVEHAWPALRYRLPAPGVRITNGGIEANYAWPGVTLRYTADSTLPIGQSAIVAGALPAGRVYTIAAFTPSGRRSPAVTVGKEP